MVGDAMAFLANNLIGLTSNALSMVAAYDGRFRGETEKLKMDGLDGCGRRQWVKKKKKGCD